MEDYLNTAYKSKMIFNQMNFFILNFIFYKNLYNLNVECSHTQDVDNLHSTILFLIASLSLFSFFLFHFSSTLTSQMTNYTIYIFDYNFFYIIIFFLKKLLIYKF